MLEGRVQSVTVGGKRLTERVVCYCPQSKKNDHLLNCSIFFFFHNSFCSIFLGLSGLFSSLIQLHFKIKIAGLFFSMSTTGDLLCQHVIPDPDTAEMTLLWEELKLWGQLARICPAMLVATVDCHARRAQISYQWCHGNATYPLRWFIGQTLEKYIPYSIDLLKWEIYQSESKQLSISFSLIIAVYM